MKEKIPPSKFFIRLKMKPRMENTKSLTGGTKMIARIKPINKITIKRSPRPISLIEEVKRFNFYLGINEENASKILVIKSTSGFGPKKMK